MEIKLETINGIEYKVLYADKGKTLIRIRDNADAGNKVILAKDYPNGLDSERNDLPEYYTEVEQTYEINNFQND